MECPVLSAFRTTLRDRFLAPEMPAEEHDRREMLLAKIPIAQAGESETRRAQQLTFHALKTFLPAICRRYGRDDLIQKINRVGAPPWTKIDWSLVEDTGIGSNLQIIRTAFGNVASAMVAFPHPKFSTIEVANNIAYAIANCEEAIELAPAVVRSIASE